MYEDTTRKTAPCVDAWSNKCPLTAILKSSPGDIEDKTSRISAYRLISINPEVPKDTISGQIRVLDMVTSG